jgi:hypothetical protein
MRICTVEGCENKHYGLGLCRPHYRKIRRATMAQLRPTRAERFAAKVVVAATGCHLWTGATDGEGRYGAFSDGRKVVRAHRWAWEQVHGPVPTGMDIDHLCRRTLCVNPGHLELVTHRENVLRGQSFAAVNAAKTHCKRGHPFTAENIRRTTDGGRQCLACARSEEGRAKQREATRRWRERQRAS